MKLIEALQSLESGARPKGGLKEVERGVPSIGGEHLDKNGYIILDKMGFVSREFYNNLRRGRIQKGDVLVVKDGATTGKVALVRKDFPYPEASVNEHVFVCRSKGNYLLPEYLFYHFYSINGQNQIKKSFHGSAIGGITTDFADNYKITIPPMETQRRIVAILDKAEETRRLRAQADELEERLLQSVFLKMFGDPVENQMGWKIEALDSLCDELYRYPTFYGFNYIETGIPVVRISNILSDGFLDPIITNYAYIDEEINKRFPRTILELNDILMAVRGDGSTAKRIGLVNQPSLVGSNISPNLIRFKTNENKLNSIFFFYLLTSPGGQKLLEKYVTRTAKKTITAGEIKRIKIICPPISIQRDFEEIVRAEWTIKQKQKSSKKITGSLFNALIQKAFTGELVA